MIEALFLMLAWVGAPERHVTFHMNAELAQAVRSPCVRFLRVTTDGPNVILHEARMNAANINLDVRVTGFFPNGTTHIGAQVVPSEDTGYLFLRIDNEPEVDVAAFASGLGPNAFVIRSVRMAPHRVLFGLRSRTGAVVAFGQACLRN